MSDDKKKIEAGTHKVKVSDWGLRETKAGNVQVYISFSNGATMFQNVNANETGDEILSRSLVLCGFKGNDLPDLFDDDALDTDAEIQIFIKYKPDQDGKPQMQVYVNDPAKQMTGSLDKKGGMAKLKELKVSLKKDLKVAKGDIKMPEKEVSDTKMTESSDKFEEDDIPF